MRPIETTEKRRKDVCSFSACLHVFSWWDFCEFVAGLIKKSVSLDEHVGRVLAQLASLASIVDGTKHLSHADI